jgi:hypothetical protein
MGRKWLRPEGLRPEGPLASLSLLRGSIRTRVVALPSARPLWTQRRRYYEMGNALAQPAPMCIRPQTMAKSRFA